MANETLRTRIGLAIVKGFKEDIRPGETKCQDFDPDTCYRAADEVIALLMGELTGMRFETKFHPSIIGPAEFVTDGVRYG